MATNAEKKALLFLGMVLILGGGVRLWRSQFRASTGKEISTNPMIEKSTKHTNRTPKAAPIEHTVDLDVASVDDLELLGVLKPGIARMIIANRDSFGSFGSITQLERIPYLRKTTITSLAPHVTFSKAAAPANAVLLQRTALSGVNTSAAANTSTAKTNKRSKTTKSKKSGKATVLH